MIKNSPISALIATVILTSLCACASQTACQRQPLKDSPAPAPLMFSKCLQEILAVGRGELDQTSPACSAFLHSELTK